MKRIMVLLLLLFAVSLFGCSKMLIEQTIEDFEKAVNEEDIDALANTISEESEFSPAINKDLFQHLWEYFNGFIPVNFYNYNISIDGSDADVYTDADFKEIEVKAKFLMRKNQAFFSFLLPDWKIYQYWDNNNESIDYEFVWKNLIDK